MSLKRCELDADYRAIGVNQMDRVKTLENSAQCGSVGRCPFLVGNGLLSLL